MFNKEIEAGMLAINVRLDNLQKDVNAMFQTLQDIQSKLAELQPQKPADSPFLTKEGLYNYKHRKPKPTE
jgi:uncharacterized membrane protein